MRSGIWKIKKCQGWVLSFCPEEMEGWSWEVDKKPYLGFVKFRVTISYSYKLGKNGSEGVIVNLEFNICEYNSHILNSKYS